MFSAVPNRYAEPKWQAYITPESKAFTFESGRRIHSLYELKIALTEENEDNIALHLKDGKNDLAEWVEHTLGDKDLATEMRHYDHRWGLIVALERQMMRSLSLPPYVAKRWLSASDIPFTFVSGQVIHSIEDLSKTLKEVSDDTVLFHRERVPNDISKWMMDIIGDYQLSELLEEANNRMQMIHFLDDHLQMLHEAVATDS